MIYKDKEKMQLWMVMIVLGVVHVSRDYKRVWGEAMENGVWLDDYVAITAGELLTMRSLHTSAVAEHEGAGVQCSGLDGTTVCAENIL